MVKFIMKSTEKMGEKLRTAVEGFDAKGPKLPNFMGSPLPSPKISIRINPFRKRLDENGPEVPLEIEVISWAQSNQDPPQDKFCRKAEFNKYYGTDWTEDSRDVEPLSKATIAKINPFRQQGGG